MIDDENECLCWCRWTMISDDQRCVIMNDFAEILPCMQDSGWAQWIAICKSECSIQGARHYITYLGRKRGTETQIQILENENNSSKSQLDMKQSSLHSFPSRNLGFLGSMWRAPVLHKIPHFLASIYLSIYIYIYNYIRRPQPSAGGARPRSTQRFSSGFVRLACIGMCRALAQAWLQRLCSALGPADASLLASESNVKQ